MKSIGAQIMETAKEMQHENYFGKMTNTPARTHKIVDWIPYDDIPDNAPQLGGLGGWVRGEGWRAFRKQLKSWEIPYYNALRDEIKTFDLWDGGFWHQNEGCPVFEDGTVLACSYRSWGDIMAAVHNSMEHCHHYSYADFAWTDGQKYHHINWNRKLLVRKKGEEFRKHMHYYKDFRKKLRKPHLKKCIDRMCQPCPWVMDTGHLCVMKTLARYDDIATAQEKGWCPSVMEE